MSNARLTSFSVAQYRSFLTRAEVRLGRRLTLLYGYNNAGKSALLRALVLIAASCHTERAKVKRPLDLTHPAARGAPFHALVTRGDFAPRLDLTLGWADSALIEARLLEVFNAGVSQGTVIERFRAMGFGQKSLQADWQPNESLEPIYDVEGKSVRIRFDGLLVAKEHAAVRERLLTLGHSMSWLHPTRGEARQRYAADARTYDPCDPIPYLAQLGADDPVFRDVQEGIGSLAGVELSTGIDAHGAYVDVAPRGRPGRSVPLAFVGEGINQVIPVLLLASMARRGKLGPAPVVAIEQPELHLHPAAELALVDVLLAATEGDAGFVLETHSETLLLGLQLAVAEGRLAPGDVSVCWVERNAEGFSTVRPVELKTDGSRAGWPPGVFSEHLVQSRKILDARANVRP